MRKVTLDEITAGMWLNDDNADSTVFVYRGVELDTSNFLALRSPWGDAPHADLLEASGVVGWMPRGAGNADPYIYVVGLDEYGDIGTVALIDATTL